MNAFAFSVMLVRWISIKTGTIMWSLGYLALNWDSRCLFNMRPTCEIRESKSNDYKSGHTFSAQAFERTIYPSFRRYIRFTMYIFIYSLHSEKQDDFKKGWPTYGIRCSGSVAPLLPVPLWPGMVAPVKVPCMPQIDIFKNCVVKC